MSRITVLAFGTLSDSLEQAIFLIKKDRRIDLHTESEIDTAVEILQATSPSILLASVTNRETIRSISDLGKNVKKYLTDYRIRSIVTSRYKEAKIAEHLYDLGIEDVILEPVQLKTFQFKFDLLVKAAVAKKEKCEEPDTDNVTSDSKLINIDRSKKVVKGNISGSNQDQDTAKAASLEHFVEHARIYKAKAGLWKKTGNYWIYITMDQFYQGVVQPTDVLPLWVFLGDHQPELIEEKDAWLFSGKTPPELIDEVNALPADVGEYLNRLYETYQASQKIVADIKAKQENMRLGLVEIDEGDSEKVDKEIDESKKNDVA